MVNYLLSDLYNIKVQLFTQTILLVMFIYVCKSSDYVSFICMSIICIIYVNSSSHQVVVFTDHNPLTFVHKMKNKNQRLLRWSLMLSDYNW